MKTLLLIDTHAFLHRAFHALPPLKSPTGKPTGALYGLTNTLLKIIRDLKPDYVVAALDRPEPTFRKKKFSAYKAHRPKAPDELIEQIVEARPLLEKLNIPYLEAPGFEADDIIGTITASLGTEKNLKIIILTGDLDALQLVQGEKVIVAAPKHGLSELTYYNDSAVAERFGLPPEKLVDYKGLVGDPSDNIPGVPGVGSKTAAALLQEFGTIEKIYGGMPKGHKLAGKVLPHEKQALLSKELATIEKKAPVPIKLAAWLYKAPDPITLKKYFEGLGFESILRRLIAPEKPVQNPRSSAQQLDNSANRLQNSATILDTASIRARPSALSGAPIKIAYDWKKLIKETGGKPEKPFFDIKVAAWLIDPDKKDLSLEALERRFLKHRTENVENALDALYSAIRRELDASGLAPLYETLELPLIPVLADMETAGVAVNTVQLRALLENTDKELDALTKKIYAAAGETFNLNSPKQTSEVLFKKLSLSGGRRKKTGTGQLSTDEETLKELRGAHPVIPLILQYREAFKIRSTYIEPLIEKTENGRVHTTFLQTGTGTGRLSSEKPNLQNIPRGSKLAEELRSAFEAPPRRKVVAYDYSQLELRLLAELADEREMKAAFAAGFDIHRLTAAKVFCIPYEKVDDEKRQLSKTLNFGVIYGMGARAFAKTASTTLKDAEAFINDYFKTFPAIRRWHEKVIAEAETCGFVKNRNGRRRIFTPSNHPRFQSEMRRMAMNMPIQSLGADIIKKAMIDTSAIIEKRGWSPKARLILSIHDELLFEVADDILEIIVPVLRAAMETVYVFSVPLRVETKTGPSWGALKPLKN